MTKTKQTREYVVTMRQGTPRYCGMFTYGVSEMQIVVEATGKREARQIANRINDPWKAVKADIYEED